MNGFENITKSASKIVLLTLVGILSIITLVVVFYGVGGPYTDLQKEVISMFKTALTAALVYYFTNKGTEGGTTTTKTNSNDGGEVSITTTTPSFLGK